MASISATELIKRSLTMLGVFGEGETLDAYHGEQARITLNYLLERWNKNGMLVYCHETSTFSLVIGKANYTIGTSGSPDITATRPTQIDFLTVRDGDVELPVTQISLEEYLNISTRSVSADYPAYFCYDSQWPLGVIRFSEVPSSVRTVSYTVPKAFTEVTSLASSINYPEGYARAIETNLAVELAVFYPGKLTAELVQAAKTAKDDVEKLNFSQNPLKMVSEHSAIGRGYNYYSIYTMDRLP